MPLYTNASICFPAYGLCFSFDPRKPAAFVRTTSSCEGRENHKLCLFCLKWGENTGIICLGGHQNFQKGIGLSVHSHSWLPYDVYLRL